MSRSSAVSSTKRARGFPTRSNRSPSDVLQGNATSFLQLAEEKFKTLREEAQVDLDARKQSISAVLNPLAQTLETYQRESRELEQRRDRELGTVGEQLRQVATHAAEAADGNGAPRERAARAARARALG